MKLTKISLTPKIWYISEEYDKICHLIESRDIVKGCKVCGSHRNIELHHVVARSQAKLYIEDEEGRIYHRDSWRNLVFLCHNCHMGFAHKRVSEAQDVGIVKKYSKFKVSK